MRDAADYSNQDIGFIASLYDKGKILDFYRVSGKFTAVVTDKIAEDNKRAFSPRRYDNLSWPSVDRIVRLLRESYEDN